MSGRRNGGPRRVVLTLTVYAAGAALLLWAAPSIQRLFLLPALFSTLVKVVLVLGFPFVAAVAWRYPDLGGGDEEEG